MENKINIDIDTSNSVNSLREMKKEMNELRGQMANASDDELVRLSKRASELNAEINRTNSLITNSGSAFTNFNTMAARTSKSLLTLDFGAAAEQAKALQGIASKMNFKTLNSGVKQATTAFKGLGKALLANPIFLIVGAVAAISFALYKLMEELGLLEPILDAVGAYFDMLLMPIKALIQGLKDLTDWFGWTSHAADAEAEVIAKANQKRAEASIRANDTLINNMNNEIALMKAQGVEIEEIEDKELELMKTRAAAWLQVNEANISHLKMVKALGLATSEQLDELTKLENEYASTVNSIEVYIAKVNKRREDERTKNVLEGVKKRQKIEEDSSKIIQNIERKVEEQKIKDIDDEITRNEKLQLLKLKWAKEDIDFSKMNSEAKIKYEEWYQLEQKRIAEEAIIAEKAREEKRLQTLSNYQKQLDELTRGEETHEEKIQRLNDELATELEVLSLEYDGKAELHEEYLLRKEIAEEKHNENINKIQQKQEEEQKKRLKELANAENELANAKIDAAFAGLAVSKVIAGENEKVANAIFAVEQGLAAGEIVADAIKRGAILKAQLAAGVARSFVDPVGGGAMIAGAKSGLIGVAASTAAGLAGIAATSIGKFKGGAGGAGGAPSINSGPDGGGGTSTPQPAFSNFRDDFAGDINSNNGSANETYILESELSSVEEKMKLIKNKKQL